MKKQNITSISKEDAEEFSESLGQIVIGSYRQILLADKMQVPQALGYPSLKEWVQERLGGLRYSVEERRKIVEELNGEGLPQAKIAAALGVGRSTISEDLKGGRVRNPNKNSDRAEQTNSKFEDILHRKKKSAAEIEVELHRAADQGVEALVWDKIKDRFLPFWEDLLNSLEEDERPFLIWAIHSFADQYDEEKRTNQ